MAERDGEIAFFNNEEWAGSIWFGDDEHFEDEEELVSRLEIALSSIQDDLVLEIRGAWPARIPEEGLPMPWARVGGEMLKLGFGDAEFDSIALEELRTRLN